MSALCQECTRVGNAVCTHRVEGRGWCGNCGSALSMESLGQMRDKWDESETRVKKLEAKLRECARIAIRISGAEVRACGLTGDATHPDDVPGLIEDIMTLMHRAAEAVSR